MVEYLSKTESIQIMYVRCIYNDYDKYLFEPECEEDEQILSRDESCYTFEYIEEYEQLAN